MSDHRVVLTFDGGGLDARLVCPESGCSPAQVCAACGRNLRPEPEDDSVVPCYDCEDADAWKDECWIKTWFDNIDASEMLQGEVEVVIDAQWDLDHLVAHIVQPSSSVHDGTQVSP